MRFWGRVPFVRGKIVAIVTTIVKIILSFSIYKLYNVCCSCAGICHGMPCVLLIIIVFIIDKYKLLLYYKDNYINALYCLVFYN